MTTSRLTTAAGLLKLLMAFGMAILLRLPLRHVGSRELRPLWSSSRRLTFSALLYMGSRATAGLFLTIQLIPRDVCACLLWSDGNRCSLWREPLLLQPSGPHSVPLTMRASGFLLRRSSSAFCKAVLFLLALQFFCFCAWPSFSASC